MSCSTGKERGKVKTQRGDPLEMKIIIFNELQKLKIKVSEYKILGY